MTARDTDHENAPAATRLETFAIWSLWSLAALASVGAGALLWVRQGENVFANMVSAAIAWCF